MAPLAKLPTVYPRPSLAELIAAIAGEMPYRLLGLVLLSLLLSATAGVNLMLLVPLLSLAGVDTGSDTFGPPAALIAWLQGSLGQLTLPAVLALFLGGMAVKALLERAEAIVTSALHEKLVLRWRLRLYQLVSESSWPFLSQQRASDVSHLLTIELERVGGAIAALMALAVQAVLALLHAVVAWLISPAMTLVAGGIGLALALALRPQARRSQQRGKAVSEAYRELYGAIHEHLSGLKVIKGHGLEREQLRYFSGRAHSAALSCLALARHQATLGLWFKVSSAAALAATFYLALAVVQLAPAMLLLLIFLFSRLVPLATGLEHSYHQLMTYLPAFRRVAEAMARYRAAAEAGGEQQPLVFQRTLQLNNVSFHYRAAPVLSRLNLTIRRGEMVAIVGPSGAGKSTLVDLLIGLLAPTEGTIHIDGLTLDAHTRYAWRRQVGYVPQEPFLFHDTIRANLHFAFPGADEATLLTALQQAAAEFVFELPEGLDTVVGDCGVQLSGGERQRLALARALLRRPALLVLDEATSALDAENEQRIQRAIAALRGAMTIVVVAHRLSTVREADVIYLLERGQLVEAGDFASLMRNPQSRFQALYRAQAVA